MTNVVDAYLQEHQLDRQTLANDVGLHTDSIADLTGKDVIHYPVEVVSAIALSMEEQVGTVLKALLLLEKKTAVIEVNSAAGLLQALKNKEDLIMIQGEYATEVRELIDTKLSDTELLGSELGAAGTLSIAAEGIYRLIQTFSKQANEQKQLETRIRRYNGKEYSSHTIVLYLRDVDY
ncbi:MULTISPECIES: hypothetical protein [Gracilibacillus]|uniref:hypothetical protein n=1 Tax=Gracilibacillus TaxID=74385 RepID=UPI000826079A|nr:MULTISPECIES: hypothetical protein [Gracilibacillus]